MREKKKILIVEDEYLLAELLQRYLEPLGHAVCKAVATGKQAIASAAREQPDIIFMDIRLAGGMDGIEAAQEIGVRYAIPIIFMTGYADPKVEQRARELNPVAYLLKPIGPPEIKSAIASAFKD